MLALNARDSSPIYEQIKAQLRRMILSGALTKGEKLPSVRELAMELAINPNTIQRAYRELEAEGYITTVANKGSFVAGLGEVDAGRIRLLMLQFSAAAAELLHLGTDRQRLYEMIEKEANAL